MHPVMMNTAAGVVDSTALGGTLMHEHVFVVTTEMTQNFGDEWGGDAKREVEVILKCANDEPGVIPGVDRILRAVAEAQRHTGAPIATHTHSGTRRGLDQQRIFTDEGLRERGVTEEEITTMFVDEPRKIFTTQGSY
jgi:predicted metal-dependent phosphotriesterase family hydrolase